jgi:hypothetical protein
LRSDQPSIWGVGGPPKGIKTFVLNKKAESLHRKGETYTKGRKLLPEEEEERRCKYANEPVDMMDVF